MNFLSKCKQNKTTNVQMMVITAMLAAISSVLMFFEFPLSFIALPFYKLDFSEVPVLIGTLAFGPICGIVVEAIKVLVHLLFVPSQTAGIGELANFLIGCSFVIPLGLIYKYKKTRNCALLGLVIGSAIMTVTATALNAFLLLPLYSKVFNMPMHVFTDMGHAIIPAIHNLFTFCVLSVAPFNLIKCFIVSIATYFLYKPLRIFLQKDIHTS
ncbi:MAG: ECF transporter S component [Bacillota bacterium]|nr:ECF transporter S component [Bacillota bacterium]